MPHFAWHLCQRGAILLPLSHLSSDSLLHHIPIFRVLCLTISTKLTHPPPTPLSANKACHFSALLRVKKTLTMGLYGAHEKLVSQQGLLLGKEVVNNLREGKKTLKVENDIDDV